MKVCKICFFSCSEFFLVIFFESVNDRSQRTLSWGVVRLWYMGYLQSDKS